MVRWDVERAPMSALLLTRLGADHGLAPSVCLDGTGLTERSLLDPDTTVTARQELTIIANLVGALPARPSLGLDAGVRYHLTTYGIWGYALISSRSWRSAIDVGLRFVDLTFAFTRIFALDAEAQRRLVFQTPDIPLRVKRFVVERDSAAVQTMQQELVGSAAPLQEIAFEFPAPSDGVERYTSIFGVEPAFARPENVMMFDPGALDTALPQANEHTAAIAQELCRQLLERRTARTGLAGQVRDQLIARPAAPPDIDSVAAALHMSERTLRRRLAEEGVSFRGLLDEIRERLAEEMLVTGGLSVAEVAERLGYLEVSSFSQAFRRWKGVGPRAYRAGSVSGAR